jgi:hypothetical protein
MLDVLEEFEAHIITNNGRIREYLRGAIRPLRVPEPRVL